MFRNSSAGTAGRTAAAGPDPEQLGRISRTEQNSGGGSHRRTRAEERRPPSVPDLGQDPQRLHAQQGKHFRNTSGDTSNTSGLQILNSCSSSEGRTPPGFRAQILSRRKRAAHYIREPERTAQQEQQEEQKRPDLIRNSCSSSAGRTRAQQQSRRTAEQEQRRRIRQKNQSGRTAPGFWV